MIGRVYMSEIEGGNVRGRPPVKWKDRVQEYVRERGGRSLRNLEQARRECQDRERWKQKKKEEEVEEGEHLKSRRGTWKMEEVNEFKYLGTFYSIHFDACS